METIHLDTIHVGTVQAVKSAIDCIRARQHEFENHLMVFSALPYATSSYEELSKKIKDYAIKLNMSVHHETFGLLRMNQSFLAAFLIGKLQQCRARGIEVRVNLRDLNTDCPLSEEELVEAFGTLIDNASEAMLSAGSALPQKILFLDFFYTNHSFRVSNTSPIVLEEDLQHFFLPGFTTKPEDEKNRGYGLYNLQKTMDKYGSISVKNEVIDGAEVLSFIVCFGSEMEDFHA